MRRLAIGLLALAGAAGAAHAPLEAQDVAQRVPRARALVEQVAGSTVYLTVGTEAGVRTGDTVLVARDSLGAPVGSLAIVRSTRTRSVASFTVEPISLTRGVTVYLESHGITALAARGRAPAAPGEGYVKETPTRPVAADRTRPAAGPIVSGRVALDVDYVRSRTRYGQAPDERIDRTFATPAVRLSTTVSGLGSGVTLRLNGRLSYRYVSAGSGSLTPTSARLYTASIEKAFETAPLQLEAGRFYNSYESYSGYWDGLMARVGGRGAGVGVLAGFEPDRWNQSFSTDLPKLTVFADFSTRGRAAGYQIDVSGHRVEPRNALLPHTFFGLSQRAHVQTLHLRQDLQVDRDPLDGGWRVTRFQLNGSVDVHDRLSLHAGVARLQPYRMWDTVSVISYARDRAGVGVSLYAGGASVGVDVAANRDLDRNLAYSYSAFVSLPRLGAVGASGNATYWSGDGYRVLSLSPGLTAALGRARLHADYRFYRSDYSDRPFTTHTVATGVSFAFPGGVRYDVEGSFQWGGGVTANRLYSGFSKSFR